MLLVVDDGLALLLDLQGAFFRYLKSLIPPRNCSTMDWKESREGVEGEGLPGLEGSSLSSALAWGDDIVGS